VALASEWVRRTLIQIGNTESRSGLGGWRRRGAGLQGLGEAGLAVLGQGDG
jgi:hypothetical protein